MFHNSLNKLFGSTFYVCKSTTYEEFRTYISLEQEETSSW